MFDINTLITEGQQDLIFQVKRYLYECDKDIFDTIDFEDDTIFLEPFLVSYVTLRNFEQGHEQILFGYRKDKISQTFPVLSDQQGVVFLPNYGRILTNEIHTVLTLEYNADQEKISLFKDEQKIEVSLEPIRKLACGIEITNRIDLYSASFFTEMGSHIPSEEIQTLIKSPVVNIEDYIEDIDRMFEILKQYNTDEYEKYMKTTRRIVLFSHPRLRNYVTRIAHGNIYLNVDDLSNLTYFLEEVVHQCSHNVFNAATFDIAKFVTIGSQRTLNEMLNNQDMRTIYGAYHGVYTTEKIVDVFIKLLNEDLDLDIDTRYELIGRLAINKNRHDIGLERIPWKTIFTPLGKSIFDFYYTRLDNYIKNYPIYFDFEINEHPVVFNYWKFKKDNPIEMYEF